MDSIMALYEQLHHYVIANQVGGFIGGALIIGTIIMLWVRVLVPAAGALSSACKTVLQPFLCKVGWHDKVDASNGLGGGENHDSYRTDYKCSRCNWVQQVNQFRDSQ